MKTTITLLCAALLTTIAGCDAGEPTAPVHERQILLDGVPVESVDDLPDVFQEQVYEVWDALEADPNPEIQFRATCTGKCSTGSISVTADKCTCQDNVGCSGTNSGGPTLSSPCPKKAGPHE